MNGKRVRSQFTFRSLFACALASAALACSDALPPYIGDYDAGGPVHEDATPGVCATPAPGCPCPEAGAKFDCGRIYRVSGDHTDCAEGFMTCQGGDAGWGACVGPTIWDGG